MARGACMPKGLGKDWRWNEDPKIKGECELAEQGPRGGNCH